MPVIFFKNRFFSLQCIIHNKVFFRTQYSKKKKRRDDHFVLKVNVYLHGVSKNNWHNFFFFFTVLSSEGFYYLNDVCFFIYYLFFPLFIYCISVHLNSSLITLCIQIWNLSQNVQVNP